MSNHLGKQIKNLQFKILDFLFSLDDILLLYDNVKQKIMGKMP
jgi:hypothetical protein